MPLDLGDVQRLVEHARVLEAVRHAARRFGPADLWAGNNVTDGGYFVSCHEIVVKYLRYGNGGCFIKAGSYGDKTCLTLYFSSMSKIVSP